MELSDLKSPRLILVAGIAVVAAIFLLWWFSPSERLKRDARALLELCRFEPNRSPAENLFRIDRMRGRLDPNCSVRITAPTFEKTVEGRESVMELYTIYLGHFSSSNFQYEFGPAGMEGDRAFLPVRIRPAGNQSDSPLARLSTSPDGTTNGKLEFRRDESRWKLLEAVF